MPVILPSRGAPARAPETLVPECLTALREGYDASGLKRDVVAGLTVAVVALPLSMAIAIACGLPPDRGLVTAAVGGFLVSAFGGSRHQIGGPAGAFIVLIAATVMRHGIDGLVLATFLSGLMLTAVGVLRMGAFVKYVPFPVTLGFTAGIGAIILTSQLRPFLGLHLDGPEPGPFLEKIPVLFQALPTVSPTAMAVGILTIAVIQALHLLRPAWPGMLIAVAAASALVSLTGLDVETIGSVFGGIGEALSLPSLPALDPDSIRAVLPDAVAFTILGAIESLLSAVVAESLTGHRHRPNAELLGQGIANMGSALFGGMPVTGTIARTATNVRAGAVSPVSGMFHALVVLASLILLAPLATAIPLAALAGVLIHVSWHMIDVAAMRNLWRTARAELAILVITLALTVLRDLTEAIVVGTALGSLYFLRRLARMSGITATPVSLSESEHAEHEAAKDTLILTLTGAYFFGSAPILESVLERIAETPRRLVIDLSAVPVIDQTGARSLASFLQRMHQRSVTEIWITHASSGDRRALRIAGLPPNTRFAENVDVALARARAANARAAV